MSKPFAITLDLGSSLANKTGTWRTERPVYVDRLPPCNHACPAGEDIQALAVPCRSLGLLQAAWESLVVNNPFPAVMGRVCYHNCETACNRGQLDSAGEHPRRGTVSGRRSHRSRAGNSTQRLNRPASGYWWSVAGLPGCPPRITWHGSDTRYVIYEAGPAPAE